MVYDWDGKEAECYRLYVQEKKTIDEVVAYWAARGFTPSKRAFQTQFRRWEFPSKQNPAHKNPALISRVKELWENNVMQKDMLATLLSEGFDINDRELMRLRLRFKWLLRESTAGFKRKGDDHDAPTPRAKKSKHPSAPRGNGLIDQLANAVLHESSSGEASEDEPEVQEPARYPSQEQQEAESPSLDPQVARKRQERLAQLQADSDERWKTRKRRRRTRGWAGLPADAPGEPPRFPSETTLDESKAYLNLDNKLYRQVREQFQAICEEQGVIKKTLCGPEKWSQVKERLIRDNAHLSNVFRSDPEATEQNSAVATPSNFKALSLDVICMDVTKRLRTLENRMGIPEAKNILGLNPEETRRVRSVFHAKLKADHFTNKLEAGTEHWDELKKQWIAESDLLAQVMAAGESDPKHDQKLKAIEVLARDVMKRLRNENIKQDPSQKKQINRGIGPGPAPPTVLPHASNSHLKRKESALASNPPQNNPLPAALSNASDLQIDPSLLLAANDPSVMAPPDEQTYTTPGPTHPNPYTLDPQLYNALPLPIYFRLHPHSSTTMPNKTVWLGILQTGTVSEIKGLAMREHPGTVIVKLEGLLPHKVHGQQDREMPVPIDDEEELLAYMEHVAGAKATFVVMLAPAQGGLYG